MFFQSGLICFRIMFFSWVLLIGVLSLVSLPGGAPEGSDKVVHLVVYFLTAGLYLRAFRQRRAGTPFFTFLAVFGYSCLLEWLQYYLPWRSFSPGDMAANLGGVILGIVLSRRLDRTAGGE